MSARPSGKAEVPSAQTLPVRIVEIPKASSIKVRLLSYNPLGSPTHWTGECTKPCQHDQCPRSLHNSGTVWKSWQAVEVWGEHSRLWHAAVLEVTEHLELDLRGVAARGQVWEVFRPVRKKGRRNSLTGMLLEERDPDTFPKPFNILVVLRSVFRVESIELRFPNPMPPRLIVAPSNDEGPRGYAELHEEPYRANGVPLAERAKELAAKKNGQQNGQQNGQS